MCDCDKACYADIVKCPFCDREIRLEESCSTYKRTEDGVTEFIGCRSCREKETIPYDHDEVFWWSSKEPEGDKNV